MYGRNNASYRWRMSPLLVGTVFFWAAIFLVALAAGVILANENLTHDVLVFAALFGVLLLCLPLEWLFIALVASAWVVAPSLQYFLGINQLTYAAPALAIVVGAKIFLTAALNRVKTRHGARTPRRSVAIFWAVFGYFLCIGISFAVNRPPAYQILLALKFYLPFWFVFFAIALGFLSTNFVIRIWRWLVPLALIQLPFTLYQHFVIAPTRPDAGWVNEADCVVGTFGGDPMGGGNSATLMIFLIVGMVVAVALNRCGRISRRTMLIAMAASLASLMLGETKAAFLMLPIALVVYDLRSILAQPARLLGMILVFGPVLFGMYRVYQVWYGTDTSTSTGYFFDPSGYNVLTGEVGRVASLTLWWADPQADLQTRLVGYGPAASRSQVFTSDGVIAKRYRPLQIAATTAAVLLWDLGVVGAAAFASILVIGAFRGLRHLPFDHSDEERQLLGAATAIVSVLLITLVYNPMLLTDGAAQILLTLCVATIHTFSARQMPEGRKLDSKFRAGAAVWGVLRARKRYAAVPAIRAGVSKQRLLEHRTTGSSAPSENEPDGVSPAVEQSSAPQTGGKGMIGHSLWAALSIWGSRATTLLVFAILTRLLPPDAIGLLAFVNVAYVQVMLLPSCLSESLMWHRNATSEDESTIFWLQLLVSILAGLALGLAGYIWGGTWIDHPDSSLIIAAFACSIPFSSAACIPEVLLRRKFAFKQLAVRSLLATALGGIVGVAMAFEGFGVWSLVWKFLVEAGVLVVFNFSAAGWIPRFLFNPKSLVPALRYGFGLAASWTIGGLTSRMDSLFIGPILGPAELGYYYVGQRPFQMLAELVNGVATKVAYPHLAAISGDRDALKELHRKLIYHTNLISAPAFAALGALAPQLVPLAFGSQWHGSPAILQVFCVEGIITGISMFNYEVLMSSGKVGSLVKLNLITLLFVTGFVYSVSHYGIGPIAIGMVLASLIAVPIGLQLAGKISQLTLRQAVRNGMPGLFAAACVWATILIADSALETESPLLRLLITSAAGALSLLIAWRMCAREFLVLIRHYIRRMRLRK